MWRSTLALVLLVTACAPATDSSGAADPSTTSTTATTTTTTLGVTRVEHDGGVAEIAGTPKRIAALSSVHIEILFAMGAGPQVIAGDLFSNYPPEAEGLVKLDSFALNVEEVIALDPDLVTLTFDPGGVVDALDAVGIPTLLFVTPQRLEVAYAQIEALGLATGNSSGAQRLVEDMRDGIAQVVRDHPGLQDVTVYHESDSFTYYTPNSNSFIGELYTMLGMVNIADAAPDELNSGFPQLSPEFIVDADPFVVVLASFGETAESLAARDGWDVMTAVRDGRIVVVDAEAAGRWGPRIVDVVREIADSVGSLIP